MAQYLDFLQIYKPPKGSHGGEIFANLVSLLNGLEAAGYRVQISAYRCVCPVVTLHALPVLDNVEVSAIDKQGRTHLLMVAFASSVIHYNDNNKDEIIVMHKLFGEDKSVNVNDIIKHLSDYAYIL